ncbi:hypothetical protein Tco_0595535 [Tanacetum coccineum]
MVFGSMRIRLSNRDGEGFVFLSPLERERSRRLLTSVKILAFPLLMSTQLNHQRKSSMVIPRIMWSFPIVTHFFYFSHHEDNDEDVVDHRFVPDWGFRNYLRICSFRAYKELISHLATFAEDEVLSGFSNIEMVRHAYQSLGRCLLSQGELLKRHEQLNSDNVALCNRSDTQLEELSHLINDLQSEMQANDGLSKKLVLLESVHSGCPDRERELMDRRIWRRRGMIGGKLPLHTSVEYRKSLVVPIGLCFTAGWLGGLNLGKDEDKVASMLSETSNLDIEGSKT